MRTVRPAPVLALIVLAGLMGAVVLAEEGSRTTRLVQAEGDFWEAVDGDGERLQPRRGERGLVLEPEGRVLLSEPEGPLHRYETLTVTGRKTGPAAWIELRLRDTGTAAWSVVLVPDENAALFVAREEDGETRIVERVPARSMASDPFGGFRLTLRRDGQRVQATLNGAERLAWDDPAGSDAGGALSVRARDGAVNLLSLEARGHTTSQRGRPEPFAWRDDFDDLTAVSPWPARLRTVALGLLVLLAAAGFLSALCRTRPGLLPLTSATLWWAAPVAFVVVCASTLAGRPPPWIAPAAGAAALAGLLLALRALADVLHAPAGTPTGHSIRRPGRTALAVVLLLAAGALAAQSRMAAFAPARDAVATAREQPLPAATAASEPLTLHEGNALTLEGPFRNLELKAHATLSAGSALQVRLRAADPDVPQGVTLVLSADERRPTAFRREEPWTFDFLGAEGPAVPPDRSLELVVRAEGSHFEAFVDGVSVARGRTREHASGAVVLMAAPGHVDLESWSVEPRPHEAPGSPARDAIGPALWLVGGAVLLAALLSRLLRLSLAETLAPQPWALIPLAAALAASDPAGRLPTDVVTSSALCGSALLLAFVVVHARFPAPGRATLPATVLAIAAVLTGPPLLYGRAVERAPDPQAVASYAHWSGERAHDDLLWIEHPLLRRWNPYLARHRFRGRNFAPDPPADKPRVVVLGGSSTWGFRLPEDSDADWPTQLQRVLAARGEEDVEVINAAWSGATGDRLYRFLRDVLLPFDPDVVVLDLYYNDAWALSQGSEEEYYARVTDDGYSRGPLDVWREQREVAAGRADLRRLMAATAPNVGGLAGRTTQQVWDEQNPGRPSPAKRYADMLERFVRLAAQEGFALVLVKEPMRDDQESLWKDEFYAAMDEAARAHDLGVVDPRAALAGASGARLFLDEIHLTPRGHAVLAETVAPAVQDALDGARR